MIFHNVAWSELKGMGLLGWCNTSTAALPSTVTQRSSHLSPASILFKAAPAGHRRNVSGKVPPNNSFKPNLLRSTNNMAEKACHVAGSATQVGLTQVLGVHGEVMNNSSMKDLIDRYLVAYNSFDVDGMLSLLSQDVRFENYSGGQLTAATSGIDELRQLAEQSKSLFSEREQRITGLEFSHDFAAATIAYRGKLAADIPNGPLAGTVLDLQGKSEFSFGNGQITKIVDRS
ncbi:nuclear transport factor 2 family protein [Lysobacter zhanggongensis]|uniref:Nuclear transport factor 2 family protein n=1 Tax=Lysobacter zhanggongensis TaxID=1774951 RepID=A0ABU7YRU1_9GAMM